MEAASFVGERYRSRRTVEQADADPVFQPRHRAADRRGRQSQRIGRPGEIAGLDDGCQDADAVQ